MLRPLSIVRLSTKLCQLWPGSTLQRRTVGSSENAFFRPGQLWGWSSGQELVGFIAFRDAWIDQLYVLPTWQGRQIGLTLLNVAKDPEHRCVVPFNSFSEFNKAEGGDIWFALDETRPLACFAGIWTKWTSVRKVREGETTNDLYAFLTTEPNAEVGAIHPKAMPVILTTPDEVETWMTAPAGEALKLQRPLPDGALRIVARGVKEDPAPAA